MDDDQKREFERHQRAEREVAKGASGNSEGDYLKALMLENATQTRLLREGLAELTEEFRRGQAATARVMAGIRKRGRDIAGPPGAGRPHAVGDLAMTGEAEPAGGRGGD